MDYITLLMIKMYWAVIRGYTPAALLLSEKYFCCRKLEKDQSKLEQVQERIFWVKVGTDIQLETRPTIKQVRYG